MTITTDKNQPFGNGVRACIGRVFALQEAVLALALVMQNFDLRLADPLYHMKIKQTLTIKPLGLNVKASLRHGMDAMDLDSGLHAEKPMTKTLSRSDTGLFMPDKSNSQLLVLFGSNAGTCQALSSRLSAEAQSSHGYQVDVKDMDALLNRLPKDRPVIIITSSYEGEPPDNALHFVHWLESLKGKELEEVNFAVFGCGHRDWEATFHRIPKLVHETMVARGADPIADMGLSDVSEGNVMADFETWLDKVLWPNLVTDFATTGAIVQEAKAEIHTEERAINLQQDMLVGTVKHVSVLTEPGEPRKQYMEIELPKDMTYDCGDYLAILPQSPEVTVRDILAHFKLPLDATIILGSKIFSPLPLGISLSIAELLREYFELSQPATQRVSESRRNYFW